jgi:tRNA threonylcarbamoyladenosine biosynthesis protein TsaE
MDVYRIDSVDDFLNLGAEEMLYGDGVCSSSWGEKVASRAPRARGYHTPRGAS